MDMRTSTRMTTLVAYGVHMAQRHLDWTFILFSSSKSS